ncbi:hypothetical protein D3C81_1488720 [compost metagenome]
MGDLFVECRWLRLRPANSGRHPFKPHARCFFVKGGDDLAGHGRADFQQHGLSWRRRTNFANDRAIEARLDYPFARRWRWPRRSGAGLQSLLLAQQLRHVGFGVLLEFTDSRAQMLERLLQHRVGVADREVFEGLVCRGKLFEQSIERIDTFLRDPRAAFQHQLLGGLDHQVGRVEQACQFVSGFGQRQTVTFLETYLTGQ